MVQDELCGILLTERPRKLPAEWPVTPAAGILNLTAWKMISLISRSYGNAPSLTMGPKDGHSQVKGLPAWWSKTSFAASCLMEWPRKLPAEQPVTLAAGILNLTA